MDLSLRTLPSGQEGKRRQGKGREGEGRGEKGKGRGEKGKGMGRFIPTRQARPGQAREYRDMGVWI